MDSENPDDRPESPKKKIRPSSTTSENTHSSSDQIDHTPTTLGIRTPQLNGLAPTRTGREAEASSSNDTNNAIPLVRSEEQPASIQEEVVSSSENRVSSKQATQPTYSEGDADSLTNEGEELNCRETEDTISLNDREAEIKEL